MYPKRNLVDIRDPFLAYFRSSDEEQNFQFLFFIAFFPLFHYMAPALLNFTRLGIRFLWRSFSITR